MSDVEKLKVNGDILDIADIRMRNVVGGDEYDAVSGTYAVGDRCIYNNIMRECVTAVETPEAFDSEKWVNTTIDEVCSSLSTSLTKSRGIGAHSFTAYPYGFVTSGATALSLFIPVNIKSEVTGVALTKLDDWSIRIPSGGYLPYSTPTSTEIAIVDGGVRIVLIKTGGWGVTNNINVSGEIESSHLTITFS